MIDLQEILKETYENYKMIVTSEMPEKEVYLQKDEDLRHKIKYQSSNLPLWFENCIRSIS